MTESGVDLRGWFLDHELEPCPRCNRVSVLPLPHVGFLMCLECGFFEVDAEWRSDLRLLGPPPDES